MPRMNNNQFHIHPNSIMATINLPSTDPAKRKLMHENGDSYSRDRVEFEMWARAGFVSGYSVSNSRVGESDATV
jgi:hypothetical protein